MLREETLDEDFLNISLQQEREWIDKFRSKQSNLSKKDSSKSSDYSFSTEYRLDMFHKFNVNLNANILVQIWKKCMINFQDG